MSVPMKKHPTDKDVLKQQLKDDLSAYITLYKQKADNDDRTFILEIQNKMTSLLDDELIPADEVFKDLIDQSTKAGALLHGLRIREGLTQIEFAKIIKTTQANLSSMERGNRPIGKNKAKLIANKFGVDYRYFL